MHRRESGRKAREQFANARGLMYNEIRIVQIGKNREDAHGGEGDNAAGQAAG